MGCLDERFAQLDTGIVDQDVDVDALGVEVGERPLDGGLVGDIERGDEHVVPRLGQGLPGLLELLGVASVHDHARAGFRQALGHGIPEAAG